LTLARHARRRTLGVASEPLPRTLRTMTEASNVRNGRHATERLGRPSAALVTLFVQLPLNINGQDSTEDSDGFQLFGVVEQIAANEATIKHVVAYCFAFYNFSYLSLYLKQYSIAVICQKLLKSVNMHTCVVLGTQCIFFIT